MPYPDLEEWCRRCREVEAKRQEVDALKAKQPARVEAPQRYAPQYYLATERFKKRAELAIQLLTEAGLVGPSQADLDDFISSLNLYPIPQVSLEGWIHIAQQQLEVNTLKAELQSEIRRLKASPSYQERAIGWDLEEFHRQAEFEAKESRWGAERQKLLARAEQLTKQEQKHSHQRQDSQAERSKSPIASSQRFGWLRRIFTSQVQKQDSKPVKTETLGLQEDLNRSTGRRVISEQLLALEEQASSEREQEALRKKTLVNERSGVDLRAEIERQQELDRDAAVARPYEYHDLSKTTQFRLLKLQAGYFCKQMSADDTLNVTHESSNYMGDLVCSLQTFELGNVEYPQFEALSYEWHASRPEIETERRKRYLLVKEDANNLLRSIQIGSNLFDFLSHLRHAEDDIWLWADAVCIDQNNLEERAQQVKLMGQIYGCADKVLAWLPVEFPEECFNSLKSLRSSTRNTNSESQSLQFYATGKDDIFAAQVLSLTYWTRNWILQEVILARTVVLVLGYLEFPMQDLEEVFANLHKAHACDTHYQHTTAVVATWPVARLADHRRSKRLNTGYPQTLCDLLPLYAENKCLNPLDHVYALYNLIGEHRKHLVVDYKLSAHDWFLEVLTFLNIYEPSSKHTMMTSALLLLKMVYSGDTSSISLSPAGLVTQVTVTAFDRGGLIHSEECGYSSLLRKHVKSMHPGIRWTLRESGSLFSIVNKDQSFTERVNTRVLGYFEVPGKQICGLAATRIQNGDRVWQFPDQHLAFIVRLHVSESLHEARVLGRCYLFASLDADTTSEPVSSTIRLGQVSEYAANMPRYDLNLGISELFTLAHSATNVEYIDSIVDTTST